MLPRFAFLFTFPSGYLFTIGVRPMFSLGQTLPPTLRSSSKERESRKHSLHKRLHMTRRIVTFIDALPQKLPCAPSLDMQPQHTSQGSLYIATCSIAHAQIVLLIALLFLQLV